MQTVEQFITSHPFINGIEITNCTNDLGKVFSKPDSANIIQAHDFIDRVVKDFYVSDSMLVTMVFPNFNPPHQGDAPLHGTSLVNLVNPQEDKDTTDTTLGQCNHRS